jgi:hypothetical protein
VMFCWWSLGPAVMRRGPFYLLNSSWRYSLSRLVGPPSRANADASPTID